MFAGGEIDPRSTELIRITKESLNLSIEAVKPGAPVWAIGREFHGGISIPHPKSRPQRCCWSRA